MYQPSEEGSLPFSGSPTVAQSPIPGVPATAVKTSLSDLPTAAATTSTPQAGSTLGPASVSTVRVKKRRAKIVRILQHTDGSTSRTYQVAREYGAPEWMSEANLRMEAPEILDEYKRNKNVP